MKKRNRFGLASGAAIAGVMGIAAVTNGCSAASEVQNTLCCKEYQAGTDMTNVDFKVDASISGQFHAMAQAVGDITVVGNGAVTDVTNACRAIATDLGADPNDAAAQGKAGTDLMTFWCGQATAKMDATASAAGFADIKGAIQLQFDPPGCTASISAQASCQAHCDVNAKCDIKVTPPKCTGGTLEVECKGGCDVTATAPKIDCTGSCTAQCSGSCQAQGTLGVDCDGTCNGTCSAGTAGTGIQADGTCKGTCSGTCTLRAGASVSCKGTCSGQCTGKCDVTPGQASVKCSGSCSADYTPLECKGGKLEGGCNVDAQCQANCNASVSARAECHPPELHIAIVGTAKAGFEGQFNVLVNTLQVNLPKLLVVVKARGSAFLDSIKGIGDVAVNFSGVGKLDTHGVACLTYMGLDLGAAVGNFQASLNAALTVTGKVGA